MTRPGYHALITGASGGLGGAFATALAPRCSTLVLAGRNATRLQVLRSALRAAHRGVAVTAVACDLTAPAGRRALLDAIAPPLDLVVNNAGINDFARFEAQSEARIEQLVALDLVAPMLLVRALLPLLRRAGRAQIVNVGSIFGDIGYPGFAVYSAAKFGLRGFTEALRRELAGTTIALRYFAPRAARTALNSPTVAALNRSLGTREDAPEAVARRLVRFVASTAAERRIGFPERLYVGINRVLPALTDRFVRAQLATVERHLPALASVPEPPKE